MIGPLERMGHRLMIVDEKRENLLLKVLQRAKVAALKQLARQNAEPDFDLVHPGSMLGGVIQDDPMRGIMQKSGTCFHRL